MEIQSGSKKLLVAAKVFLLFSLGSSLLFGEPHTVQSAGLDDFRWKNRLIVISAASPSDRQLLDQRKFLLGRNEEILDRDLKIIQITGRGQNLIDDLLLSRESAAEFQSRLRLSMKEFQILLVGKDGTVKLKSSEPVPASLIFSLIDSMPMRRREMRESNDPPGSVLFYRSPSISPSSRVFQLSEASVDTYDLSRYPALFRAKQPGDR